MKFLRVDQYITSKYISEQQDKKGTLNKQCNQ